MAETAGNWSKEEIYAAREMGHLLLSEGKYFLALSIFEGLLAIDPGDGYSHLAAGIAYRRLKRDGDAIRELLEALRIEPRLWNAAIDLAEIYLLKGEGEKAGRYASLAENLSRSPGCPQLVRQRARQLSRLAGGTTPVSR